MSGYTERVLASMQGLTHIDHFKKRDLFPQLTFCWENLIVDDHTKAYGSDYKDSFGLKVADYDRIINPVDDDPHDYFEYLTSGEIIAKEGADKAKAEFTIKVFNLNERSLVCERESMIKNIVFMKKGGTTSSEILRSLKNIPFPSVAEYFCQPDIFEAL